MSTALYGAHAIGFQKSEELARATTENVDVDAAPDVEPDPPEFNEVQRSEKQHAGLTTSNLASAWAPGEKYVPSWAGNANVTPSFAEINSAQAQVGTAAAREMAGQFGHGSMPHAIGIEPVLRDGGVFGVDYFAADEPGVQPFAGYYMEQAPGYDRDITGAVAGRAANTSHQAAAAGYSSMWAGAMAPGVRHG